MIHRDDLPYFCVFCQIRKRLEKTAEADDWFAWDRYVFGNLKQSRLPKGWKKPAHAPRKARPKRRKKPKKKPKRKIKKKRKARKPRAKRRKGRR